MKSTPVFSILLCVRMILSEHLRCDAQRFLTQTVCFLTVVVLDTHRISRGILSSHCVYSANIFAECGC